jgi:hypothetical protein
MHLVAHKQETASRTPQEDGETMVELTRQLFGCGLARQGGSGDGGFDGPSGASLSLANRLYRYEIVQGSDC